MAPSMCHYGAMNLTPYVDSLRREFLAAAEAAGKEVLGPAERLMAPLEASVRLTLLSALSAAADEISRELAPGAVDIRLRGRDPGFVVMAPPPETEFGPFPGIGSGFASGSRSGFDYGPGVGFDSGTRAGSGSGVGSDSDPGSGSDPGYGASAGVGFNSSTGIGAGVGFDTGIGTGEGTGSGGGVGFGTGSGDGSGSGSGFGCDSGNGSGSNSVTGTGCGVGINTGSGAGSGSGTDSGPGSGSGTGCGPGTGADSGPDPADPPPNEGQGTPARINFRPPGPLKARIEEAAGREGLSVNAWLVRAATVTLDAGDRRTARRAPSGQHSYTGWVR
ncbi:hypothetical protein ABIE67_008297 [Streptomyces sp. V4I8]